ncbi:MAG: hypothetical protein LUH10_15555 [Tannerellaceae bacterium]|nr:hypothetical protein [Tannerellaceae bacterium]
MKSDKNIYGYDGSVPMNPEEEEKMKERYPVQPCAEDIQTEDVEDIKTEVDELGVGEDTRERG